MTAWGRTLLTVSIPEDLIKSHLDSLLNSPSSPAAVHRLHVVRAPIGPLGLPDESKCVGICAMIVPGASIDANQFVCTSVRAVEAECVKDGTMILFAGLAQQVWTIEPALRDRLADRLRREGKLREHPDTVEAVAVYAACRDGRRWGSVRYVTGESAAESVCLEPFVGKPDHVEGMDMAGHAAPLLRRMVGIGG